MDAHELHRLGRCLLALSRAAIGQAGDLTLVPGQEAVLEELLRHPDSTVSEIRDRTGFTQSHVSASVAKLRAHGLLDSSPDPRDGRRTRLRVTADLRAAVLSRAGRDVTPTLTKALGAHKAEHALALLEELSQLLEAREPE